MKETAPRPPGHLSAHTTALWRKIVAKFELQPEHRELLRLGLEALDRCDQARRRLAKDGLTVKGARGTIVKHPLVSVEIESRVAAVRCLKELGLTEYAEEAPPSRDTKGKFE